jgi:4-hydroxybenzoate polyprenyltransferase
MTRQLNNPLTLGNTLSRVGRPQNALFSCVLATGSYLVSGGRSISTTLSLYLLLLLLYAVAANINNLIDYPSDKINKRADNPLISGELSPKVIKIWVSICLLLIALIQFFLSQPASLIATGSYIVLLFSYSNPWQSLKRLGIAGTLVLGLCYTTLPALTGLAQTSAPLIAQWPVILPLLLASMSGLLAKDYKDLKGDHATNTLTPLVRYGARKIHAIAIGLISIAIVIDAITHTGRRLPVIWLGCYLVFCHVLHMSKGKVAGYSLRLGHFLLIAYTLNRFGT